MVLKCCDVATFFIRLFSDLQEAIDKKLGKKNSTFADIVNFYIKDKPHIKLYNRETLQKDITRPNNIEKKLQETMRFQSLRVCRY